MKKANLYYVWGALFIVCAGFGFIREPQGGLKALLVLLAAGFFVPGGLLLHRGLKSGDTALVKRICLISALSLGLTMLLLIANFLSIFLSQQMGNVLYALLVIVSAPMACGQYWAVSLFAWACLLLAGLQGLRKLKKG